MTWWLDSEDSFFGLPQVFVPKREAEHAAEAAAHEQRRLAQLEHERTARNVFSAFAMVACVDFGNSVAFYRGGKTPGEQLIAAGLWVTR